MKTSVVITSYNGSSFLQEQLDSILNQTVKPDEIVIFDDCSTDDTREIISEYAKAHDQYHWIVHFNAENLGWRKNFHEALKASSGDLLFLSDQDDIWMPNKLEEMCNIMTDHPEIRLLAHTYTDLYPDKTTKRQDIGTIPGDKVCLDKGKGLYRLINTKNIIRIHLPGCSFCIRRPFFDLCDRYWIDSCPHDALLWRYATLSEGVYIVDQSLILYRRHDTSTWQTELKTESKHSKEKALMWREAELGELYHIRQFAAEENISERYRKQVEKNIAFVQLRQKFYKTKNPLSGLALVGYMDLYPNIKGWMRDWLVTYYKAGKTE